MLSSRGVADNLIFAPRSVRVKGRTGFMARMARVAVTFVLLAGLSHVWLHHSGKLDSDVTGQTLLEQCLLCELPVAAADGPGIAPEFAVPSRRAAAPIASAYRLPFHWRKPPRAPPLS